MLAQKLCGRFLAGFRASSTVVLLVGVLSAASVSRSLLGAPVSVTTTVKPTLSPQSRTFKVFNNYIAAWHMNSSDKSRDQVELFNRRGERLFSLNPLKAVQDAVQMSIWDVGVGASGLVAVAAVFADEERRPSASLLLYSSTGGLIRAYSLTAEQGIRRLAVDESDCIWALGDESGSGDVDPAVAPMVFKYNASGDVVGRYIPRAELPPVFSVDPASGRLAGPDALGLTKDGVWFWLPDRRALVTFHRDGTHIEFLTVGAPAWTPPEGAGGEVEVVFGKPVVLSSGLFVVPVSFHTSTSGETGLYKWTKSGAWTRLTSTLPAGSLRATEGDQLVFGWTTADRQQINLETVELPL